MTLLQVTGARAIERYGSKEQKSRRSEEAVYQNRGRTQLKKKRYVFGAVVAVLVCELYYVIDYTVVSGNVRRHVEKNLAIALQGVAQMQPSQLTAMAPTNFRSDIYNDINSSYRVVNSDSYFVQKQVEDNTWLALNNDPSSPICLVTAIQISLNPENTSIMAIATVRFVGPFGISRSMTVPETQPVKQFPLK